MKIDNIHKLNNFGENLLFPEVVMKVFLRLSCVKCENKKVANLYQELMTLLTNPSNNHYLQITSEDQQSTRKIAVQLSSQLTEYIIQSSRA